MHLSCAFATSPATPEHIAAAEGLGYERAWCYDSPALYPDVWMTLALTAQRTSTIGLGPAVLVPSLRHPMTNAAAIATLAALAPGHEDHLVAVTDRDRPAVVEGIGLLPAASLTGTAAEVRAKVAQLADAGVTEIAYQPAGPDIPGELERFARAVG